MFDLLLADSVRSTGRQIKEIKIKSKFIVKRVTPVCLVENGQFV